MLRGEGLTKRYRGHAVVSGVDLALEPGKIVGLVGANGAGKSTTIKMLAGLIAPSAGSCLLEGRPTTEAAVRARIGYLPEDSPMYEELDVPETLRFFARLYGVPWKVAAARSDAVLDRLDLPASERGRPVGQFSKGMMRKVAIARALLHDPSVLLLDEPTSGLDPLTVQAMGRFFLELRDEGHALLLSAHNLSQVEEVCDEILILHQGRLVASGTLGALRERWGRHRYHVRATAAFEGSVPDGPVFDGWFADWAAVEAAVAAVRAAGGVVLEVQSEPPRLDEILARVAEA